jgi:hypothetical protein
MCRRREGDQKSKALIWLPWYATRRVRDAVQIAETRLGRPPNAIQVFAVFDEQGFNDFAMPVNDCYKIAAVIMSMLREHLLFMDKVGYTYTIYKQEGYYTFSEILCQKYPGY